MGEIWWEDDEAMAYVKPAGALRFMAELLEDVEGEEWVRLFREMMGLDGRYGAKALTCDNAAAARNALVDGLALERARRDLGKSGKPEG
jgi:hypothetical protein